MNLFVIKSTRDLPTIETFNFFIRSILWHVTVYTVNLSLNLLSYPIPYWFSLFGFIALTSVGRNIRLSTKSFISGTC